MFTITSRYYNIKTSEFEGSQGKIIVYVKRRFIAQPERFDLLLEHVLTEGERLDNLTAQYLGDPEQFWRICDANGVLSPDELTEIGNRIRITLPEGIPAIPNA